MREFFHVPENYYLSHSVGCLPKTTETTLRDSYFAPWKTGTSWAEWMPVLHQYRQSIADCLGVAAFTICPQTNVSSGLVKFLYSLPRDPNRTVLVLSREDFPTIGFVMRQAQTAGFTLRFVEGDPTQIDNWRAAVDNDVALVHVTHVLSNSSHSLPVAEICALARKTGAVSVVDVAQSIGAVPVSPLAWGADAVIGTGVKYLCCGPGACFLYVAKDRIPQCRPLDVGWFSHENPFEMDIAQFRFAEDAMRFFGGTPSPAPFVMANAALETWRTLGRSMVNRRIQDHLDRLCVVIPDESLISPRQSSQRGATLVIEPGIGRPAFREAVEAEAILCDERREGFRLSVHGYTDRAEIDRLAQILSRAN